MPTDFSFASTPLIHFGPGSIQLLPDIVKRYGRQLLLVTGRRSFTGGTRWIALSEKLVDRGIAFHHFAVDSEPSPGLIDEAYRQFRPAGIDVVVAVGGGSALDAGKAIAAALKLDGGSIRDYLEGVGQQPPDGRTLPFIAAPTTSGTGSEATKNAVLSEPGPHGFKRSLRHDKYVPRVALVDPELTLSCPPAITAASGMDAFTQLLESFLSTNGSPLTEALAIEGLRRIVTALPAVMADGQNLEARSDMAYAALLSGITLANAGLGTVHGFASSIGGRYRIPHGVICATLTGAVNRHTLDKVLSRGGHPKVLEKYATVGRLLTLAPNRSAEYYARLLIDQIDQWIEDFDIPRFSAFDDFSDADIPAIAAATSNKYHPVELSQEELEAILEERV